MIRRMPFCLILALLVCLSAVAMAATGESGESVNYDGSGFRVYDVEAIAVIDSNTEHNGVKVADKPEMKAAVETISAKLEEDKSEGILIYAEIVGYEDAALYDRIDEAVDELSAAALAGSSEMTVYEADQLNAALSTTSGIGYVMLDGIKVPYVRVAIKIIYAPVGDYAGLTEEQRTVYENYTFIYNSQTKEFELASILTYKPNYVS